MNHRHINLPTYLRLRGVLTFVFVALVSYLSSLSICARITVFPCDSTRFWGDRLLNGSNSAIGPLSVLSCFYVCNVGALWANGWTDQDETWQAGRFQLWSHCVRCGPSPPPQGGEPRSPILRVEVRISKLVRMFWALPVVANFVALERQLILV